MDLEYKGGNCVLITYKKAVFAVDPRLSQIGLKDQGAQAAVHLLTQHDFGAKAGDTLLIDGPGEYEAHNCSIRGIGAIRYSEIDEKAKNTTIYRFDVDDITVVILGHIQAKLSESQLEALGVVDIVIVPVGGGGYTLDPKEAVDLIRSIEPKIVIPTHYAEEGVNYEVPQLPLDEFIKELGVACEETPKLRIKPGMLPAALTLYKLSRNK